MKVIDRDTLQRHLHRDTDFILLEALPRESFEECHLPGAVNVPLGSEFDERVEEAVPDTETPVVVYCANAQCKASEKAAARLEELGYCEVYDYEAGKEDWKEHGLPTEQTVATSLRSAHCCAAMEPKLASSKGNGGVRSRVNPQH